jgi:hypothetical protein
MMYDQTVRGTMSDILLEITAPKKVEKLECLKVIADIIRFVLTLFVHEQDADYRLLAAILDSSQHIFYQNNRRKQTIAQFLMDHGIWQDTGAWRDCIEANLKIKMNESALRMKRRASRASQAAPPKTEKEEV